MPVSDPELRASLERALGARVARLSRHSWPYQSSFPIEQLDVVVDGRPPARMLLKELSAGALAPAAAAAKPTFLLDGRREVEVYRDVLAQADVGAPACYAGVAEPARAWVLLELVEGDPLWQVGELEAWAGAARWLAKLHSRARAAEPRRLLRYDAGFFMSWLGRALEFAPGEQLERIAAAYGRVVARLAAWPASFVHGEFYPSNILVERAGGRFRIRPVDWEMAGTGPGLLDLAALSSGAWSAEARERLARAYFDAAAPALRAAGWSDFLDALDHCRLYLAVQWLGWSPDWSPPEEHAHDWLSEALELAERLDP